MPGVYPDPVFGLSAGVDEDSRCWRRHYGTPRGTSSMNQQCLTEGALKLLTYNCQQSTSLGQPGGPVRGAGLKEPPAGDSGKRGGACPRPQWTLCVHRCRCFLSPATHTEPPAGVLAGLQVAAMPTRNSSIIRARRSHRIRTDIQMRLLHPECIYGTSRLKAGAPTSSAQQSPASHPPCPPPTRCSPRSKTPTAARHSQRNSSRRSAPS
jgi:hypothetical protein